MSKQIAPVSTSKSTTGANQVRTSTPKKDEKYLRVPISSILAKGLNPRKTFNEEKLQELTESVREKGVLEPLLVRPLAKPQGKAIYELIASERRLKAAKRANLAEVPVIVSNYTDQEALEIAVVENEQRDDVPVLEKAEGYQRLMKQYDFSAEMLAARIHKTEAHVHATVKLLIIPDFAKKLLDEGAINKSLAEIIARVPSEAGRVALAKKIIYSRDGKKLEVASVREAKDFADEFTKELSKATFDTTDATLVPEMGACTTCPYKSGNNRLEFPTGRADICNLVSCYQSKVVASRERTLAKMQENGATIIPESVVKQLMPYGDYLYNLGPYIELSRSCSQDSKYRSYKQLVGKKVKLHIAVSPNGEKMFELALRDDVHKALLAEHNINLNGREKPSREQREHKDKMKARAQVIPVVLEKVATHFQRAATGGFSKNFDRVLRMTASSLLERIESDALRLICKRRGIAFDGQYPSFAKLLREQLASMSGAEIYGLITECTVAAPLHSWKSYYSSDIRTGVGYEEIFKSAGVDIKALESAEMQAIKSKHTANKASAKKKKKR